MPLLQPLAEAAKLGHLSSQENVMSYYIHMDHPSRHPGVERLENFVHAVRLAGKGFSTARGLSTMLLAAMVAALVVVADQLIDTWADGHLLAAWVLLWLVGFAALGLLANPARLLARKTVAFMDNWSHQLARRRADERMWAIAAQDPRVMAELQAAIGRAQG